MTPNDFVGTLLSAKTRSLNQMDFCQPKSLKSLTSLFVYIYAFAIMYLFTFCFRDFGVVKS